MTRATIARQRRPGSGGRERCGSLRGRVGGRARLPGGDEGIARSRVVVPGAAARGVTAASGWRGSRLPHRVGREGGTPARTSSRRSGQRQGGRGDRASERRGRAQGRSRSPTNRIPRIAESVAHWIYCEDWNVLLTSGPAGRFASSLEGSFRTRCFEKEGKEWIAIVVQYLDLERRRRAHRGAVADRAAHPLAAPSGAVVVSHGGDVPLRQGSQWNRRRPLGCRASPIAVR
jgi:hypothetical protein